MVDGWAHPDNSPVIVKIVIMFINIILQCIAIPSLVILYRKSKDSHLYICTLLVTSYLCLMSVPACTIAYITFFSDYESYKNILIYLFISMRLSLTADAVIYIFLQPKVRGILHQNLKCWIRTTTLIERKNLAGRRGGIRLEALQNNGRHKGDVNEFPPNKNIADIAENGITTGYENDIDGIYNVRFVIEKINL